MRFITSLRHVHVKKVMESTQTKDNACDRDAVISYLLLKHVIETNKTIHSMSYYSGPAGGPES